MPGPRAGERRLRRYLLAHAAALQAERVDGADEDVCFPESLVADVLTDLTEPGAAVLDPFCGFGTTLRVARRMGRRAVGVELLPERAALAARRVPDAVVLAGDARRLAELGVADHGPYDLVLTSPPYRTERDHPEDPLAGYERCGGSYSDYLADLTAILCAAAGLLAPGGHLVVNVANIGTGREFTPLAWDLGRCLTQELDLVRESFVCWDHDQHDLGGDYLLHFRPRA